MEELINYDQQLFVFLNGLGAETWDGFWLFITNKMSSIPLYALLLFVIYKKLGLKPTLLLLVFVALMITASDQLSNTFKNAFERLRPCHEDAILSKIRLVKSHCGGKYGYFSAHASNSFAVATFFALLLKQSNNWWPLFLLIWALVIAYSRIYIGVHYPLDVISGISFGLLFGWGFYKLFIFISKRIIPSY